MSNGATINFTSLTLTLLFRCNYRCPSCLVGNLLESREAISFEQAVAAIESSAKLNSFTSIAFVGGEPFLVYDLMLKIADHVHTTYGKVALSASTNAYWAKRPDTTLIKLQPLAELGLSTLLLSWDDFHAEFGKIDQIANAISACNELNIYPTVQNIYVNGASRIEHFKHKLDQLCDTSRVEWTETHCTPVGLGASLDPAVHQLIDINDLSYGDCNAGEILNIEADGSTKPCCGAGLMAGGLTMGNAKSETVYDIVRRASVDPIFNSLVAYKGPKHLAVTLQEAGRHDLVPRKVTGACDACYQITNNPEAMEVLAQQLEARKIDLLINRAASEHLAGVPSAPAAAKAQSAFQKVPNFERAEAVPVLAYDDHFNDGRFRCDHLDVHEPLLVRDLFSTIAPSLVDWTRTDRIRKSIGDCEVAVTIGMTKVHDNQVRMPLSAYLDRIEHRQTQGDERGTYVAEHPVPQQLLEELDPLLARLSALCDSKRRSDVMCFIGRNTYTGCHEHGGHEAFLIQLAGSKEVLLHRPTWRNHKALAAGNEKDRNWSPISLLNPDLEMFPELADNQPTYTAVGPGEILFIPDGWYHAVATNSDELSLTVTLFLPAAFLDLAAAPRWLDFKRTLANGHAEERADSWRRIGSDLRAFEGYLRQSLGDEVQVLQAQPEALHRAFSTFLDQSLNKDISNWDKAEVPGRAFLEWYGQ